MSRNHDAYTSFIKTQEKVLLIPMRIEMERMIRNQEQIVSLNWGSYQLKTALKKRRRLKSKTLKLRIKALKIKKRMMFS